MNLALCPDPTTLQRLIDGQLDHEAEAELAEHLDHCEPCRTRLEQLTSDSQVFPSTSPDTDPAAHARTETMLRQVVSKLEHEGPPPNESPAPDADDDWRSLLAPAENSSSLGRLGGYEILEVLGRGGMGIVFRARDDKLGRVVAVKILSPQLAAVPIFRQRFTREAKAAAAINHPHVVTLYAVEEVDGLPLIAMEFIRGRTLGQRLRESGALPIAEALRIGSQTAQALAAAHAQGLIHRDVKPDNILLENGIERVKLSDFGLARLVDESGVTQSGMILGTPQYLSPEQAQGKLIDARSDLFCLGCVLYAMATGHSPFSGGTAIETLRNVLDKNPPPLRAVRPEAPWELESLVSRLLEKQPDGRPSSAAEVADELTRLLAARQDGVSTSEPVKRAVPITATGGRRRWQLAVAALALLIVLVGVSETTGVTNLSEALATIFRITTPTGTLVIEANEPGVVVTVDGEEIRIDTPGEHQLRLKPGQHKVEVQGERGTKASEVVTISRDEKQLVRIWFEPNGQPKIAAGDGPQVVTRVEIGDAPATITRDGVTVEEGALKLSADETTTFRLAVAPFDALDETLLTYRAKLKTEGLEGKAYLEMWVRAPGRGEFFSKGLTNPATGTTDWDAYETPFILQKGEFADQAKLNVVVEGKGTVWIKDIELLRAPLPQQMRMPVAP